MGTIGSVQDKEIILIALGGNALIRAGQRGTAEEQFENLRVPMRQIARLSAEYRIIITHGNGPQVGNLLLQQERCDEVPPLPLEILVAQTQGQIGYMIESTLDSELMAIGTDTKRIVSLISYVVVDEDDPAFSCPTKPIGPAYPREASSSLGFPMLETAKGFRRAVVSPQPVTIVEKREIRQLIDLDFIVICCGGGGIPVVRHGRAFDGVDAVIDKDLASAKLGAEVGAKAFIMATDVEGAAIHFGSAQQRYLGKVSLADVNRYAGEGHFATGSMGPKVEAARQFVSEGGDRAAITHLTKIEDAVDGTVGTQVVRT